MRILVEHGEHQHRNRGDVAMLVVAVARLRQLWPDAELAVITGDPERLDELIPGVFPVRLAGSRAARLGSRFGLRSAPDPLEGIDVVAAIGGGYLTDVDPDQTERALKLLIAAQERGIPTIMFGQGIGPLREPRLRELAARALGGARLIALREEVCGAPLLAELGVPAGNVVVTGDDAIPLARTDPPTSFGAGLAVNHRLAGYLDSDDDQVTQLRTGIHAAAYDHGAPLIPIPVSEWDDDRPGTARITDGYPLVEQPDPVGAPPITAIKRLDRARVVVTSTYHLAVFALSRGIPAVTIASSDYYRAKFAGLGALFGDGLRVVDMTGDDPSGEIVDAVDDLWERAEELRPVLLAAADRQIAAADAAYARARDLVQSAPTRR